MPLSLKATVTRHPPADLVDQAEHQLQAEHHEAAENPSQTAIDAATVIEPEKPDKRP